MRGHSETPCLDIVFFVAENNGMVSTSLRSVVALHLQRATQRLTSYERRNKLGTIIMYPTRVQLKYFNTTNIKNKPERNQGCIQKADLVKTLKFQL